MFYRRTEKRRSNAATRELPRAEARKAFSAQANEQATLQFEAFLWSNQGDLSKIDSAHRYAYRDPVLRLESSRAGEMCVWLLLA